MKHVFACTFVFGILFGNSDADQKNNDMWLIIIEVVLLLAVIIIPLQGPKPPKKKSSKPSVVEETKKSNYAVNEDGSLEKIHRASLSDHE